MEDEEGIEHRIFTNREISNREKKSRGLGFYTKINQNVRKFWKQF